MNIFNRISNFASASTKNLLIVIGSIVIIGVLGAATVSAIVNNNQETTGPRSDDSRSTDSTT